MEVVRTCRVAPGFSSRRIEHLPEISMPPESPSRRQVLNGVTVGAAAAAAAAVASAAAAQQGAPSKGGRQDPRTKYPKPPFPT